MTKARTLPIFFQPFLIAAIFAVFFILSNTSLGHCAAYMSAPADEATARVYLIVDPHGDPAGQRRVSEVLDRLHRDSDVRLVFLEAATGDVSLSFLSGAADSGKLRDTADRYLRASFLNGSEWTTLFAPADNPVALWGVENPDLYERTILLYRGVAGARAAASSPACAPMPRGRNYF